LFGSICQRVSNLDYENDIRSALIFAFSFQLVFADATNAPAPVRIGSAARGGVSSTKTLRM
jgi:hypothetical protein